MIQAASEITEWYNVQQALIEADTYNLIAYCVGRTPQPFQVAAEFTGVSIVSLILMVVGGFFDLLSLGTGVFKAYYNGEGWAWGIFSDSLRLLVVAGPLAKGIKLISVPALTEVLVPAGETPFCTLISTIRALQETRIANFASVEEICLALKIKAQAYGLSEIVGIVKKLGGVSRTLGRTKFLQGIEGRAASNPTRVYLVDLRWKNDWAKGGGDAAHTVMVQYCPAKNCVMWWDPSGAYGNTLAEVEKMILQNPANQQMKGMTGAIANEVVEIERARISFPKTTAAGVIRAVNTVSWTKLIALELWQLLVPRRTPQPTAGPSPHP